MNTNTTKEEKKVIETLIRVKLTYSGKQHGTTFKVPYTLAIKLIEDTTTEICEMDPIKWSCDVPENERFGTKDFEFTPFLQGESNTGTTAYTRMSSEPIILTPDNDYDAASVADDMEYDDFQVELIVLDHEEYETSIPTWGNMTYGDLADVEQGNYTRTLIKEYHHEEEENEEENEEDKTKEIIFNIKAETEDEAEDTDFKIEIHADGTMGDSYSWNPNSGWTNWDNFTDGWSSQNQTCNQLLSMIHTWADGGNYAQYAEFVETAETEDVGSTMVFDSDFEEDTYDLTSTEEGYVKIIVTIDDVEYTD